MRLTSAFCLAALILVGALGVGWGLRSPTAQAQTADAGDWDGLAPGPGREEVFYLCQPCHSLAIVKQQRLSRDVWEETLRWMIEEQGMPEPEPEELTAILDYLSSRLGPDTPR